MEIEANQSLERTPFGRPVYMGCVHGVAQFYALTSHWKRASLGSTVCMGVEERALRRHLG
jgi:hypothetical protein